MSKPKIDAGSTTAIETILKRGNAAVVKRKGDGIVVLEEIRKRAYDLRPIAGGEGQSEPNVS